MVGHKLGEFAPTRQFVGHTPAEKGSVTCNSKSAQPSASSGVKDGKNKTTCQLLKQLLEPKIQS